jgi:hypothetical protein
VTEGIRAGAPNYGAASDNVVTRILPRPAFPIFRHGPGRLVPGQVPCERMKLTVSITPLDTFQE